MNKIRVLRASQGIGRQRGGRGSRPLQRLPATIHFLCPV